MSELSPELTQAVEQYGLSVSADLSRVTGRLEYGVLVDGVVCCDFAMHLLTVREDMEIDMSLSGQARMMAVFAATTENIGTLTGETLTPDFLAGALVSSDFDAMYYAQELLRKKRLTAAKESTDTVMPS